MTKITAACVVVCLWVWPISASGRPAADAARIEFRIKPTVQHRVDPRVFGQFMERPSWGEIGVEGARVNGTRKLQPAVLELLAEMRIPVIRFPGGTDVDFLDWCDMVDNVPGRAAQRPVSTGHLGHKVTNNFGYDEFLAFCEEVGAEAIVVVNFRDGLLKKKPLKEAAEHAAALVAYCNAPVGKELPEGMYDWPSLRARNGRPQPYKAKYFQIGNETWAFVKPLKDLAGGDAVQWYAECLGAYVEAMRAVDPSIQIIVDGHDGDMSGIVPHVRERLGDKIAFFATHFYSPWAINRVLKDNQEVPISEIPARDIWNAWVAVTDFDASGQAVLNHPGLNAARQFGYKVGVTEWNWNGWWRHGGPQASLDSSWAKGLGAAGYLHAFIRAGDVIELGCQSMLVGNSWAIHAIAADAKGQVPPYYMPTGQVTMFYSKHHGDQLLALESRNVPMYEQPYQMGGIRPSRKIACIDALATAGEKRIYFHAINRSLEEPLDITVDVSAFEKLDGRATHYVLEGRLNDAPESGEARQVGRISQTDIRLDGDRLRVTLPHRSVSCIEFVEK